MIPCLSSRAASALLIASRDDEVDNSDRSTGFIEEGVDVPSGKCSVVDARVSIANGVLGVVFVDASGGVCATRRRSGVWTVIVQRVPFVPLELASLHHVDSDFKLPLEGRRIKSKCIHPMQTHGHEAVPS